MNESEQVQCVLCGHRFHSGGLGGYIYCPACGRRFNPHLTGEETMLLPGPEAARREQEADAVDEPQEESPTGRRFGEYDIVDEIARGGMGVVYLARQRVLRRVVALKVLRSGDNASTEERERLLREAKAAAGLSHPNIVPIHEFSIHQGQPYFTMDYIDGKPLDQMLESGPLNVRQAVEIIATVSRAIAYAHTKGIIHRDLKPANIIITPDGRPMITDFGLAVEQAEEGENKRRMTMAGAIMGTIPYAPPEQASGKIDLISERSDVYSMGAVLYEMVTGRPPFTGFTQFELMRRVINHDPTPPRQINPKVHRDVETITLKCLEKDQRRRYTTANAFADDCQSFLKGEVITARPATLGYRCRRFLARRPLLNLLGALVLLLSMIVWFGIDNVRALARENEQTTQELELERAERERISLAKEESERYTRRDWRTEYNINFDYVFRFEYDLELSRRQGIPWVSDELRKPLPASPRPGSSIDRPRLEILADPPRLALNDPDGIGAGPETPFDGKVDLGFPFQFPRDVRVTLRLSTPKTHAGELVLSLDVDRDYRPHLGTTTVRFGSPTSPGIFFYRSGTIIGEDAAFHLRAGATHELVLERADNRLRAYVDSKLVLATDDPPPVFNADPGRISLDVKDGALEFLDLSVDLLGLSRNSASTLIDTANSLAAQGRSEAALRLYISVLQEPTTDAQTRLKALRGYARSLLLHLPRRDRNQAGIEKACHELNSQLASAGQANPTQLEYLIGLVLATSQLDSNLALDALQKTATMGHSSDNPTSNEYADLARFEILFVNLRRGLLEEAARNFENMSRNGTITRLYDRFGGELGGGGQVALILEKVDPLIAERDGLDTAATLLRAAAAIAPSSRECANNFRRLGRVEAELGNYDKAVDRMHWAERISPDWFRPYLDEARIHFDRNNPAAAGEALERAAAAIPQSLDLNMGIARLYLDELPARLQDPVKAEKAARAAATLSQRGNPAVMELLASALFRQKRLTDALAAVESAIKVESSPARVALRDNILRELEKREAGNGSAKGSK